MCDTQGKLNDLLRVIAAKQGIQNFELKVSPISTGGANYSSLLYVATITSINEKLNLFIKVAAMGEKIREQIPLKIYETEIFVYTELKADYKALEDKFKVSEKHRLYIPEYYGSNATIPDEIIVLEDLASKGFTTHDRMKTMDWEYASTAVSELVKLQALSMAYRRGYPDQFKRVADCVVMDWLNEDTMEAFWVTGFQTTLNVVREENTGKVKKFFDATDLAAIKEMYTPLRCKIITHGDYRPSNLMHRRKDVSSYIDT